MLRCPLGYKVLQVVLWKGPHNCEWRGEVTCGQSYDTPQPTSRHHHTALPSPDLGIVKTRADGRTLLLYFTKIHMPSTDPTSH